MAEKMLEKVEDNLKFLKPLWTSDEALDGENNCTSDVLWESVNATEVAEKIHHLAKCTV